MTLSIGDKNTGKTEHFHYADVVIDGDVVYLKDKKAGRVWNRTEVEVKADEADHIYVGDQLTGELRQIA